MKLKWYISTLILGLTVLGICINKISSPNQEILVQFDTGEVTTEQFQTALANIKKQLQAFGIEDMQVYKDSQGKLRISYYSSVDVDHIKNILSADESLHIDYKTVQHSKETKHFPSGTNSKHYNLDIYEIHKTSDGHQGSAGKSVWIVKQDFDRFLNPHVSLPYPTLDVRDTDQSVKRDFKLNRVVALAIDKISRAIPEVRAGPFCIGNA